MNLKTDSIVLGGGCFWCLDAAYRLLDGVDTVQSGYAGGTDVKPSYYDVCSGKTGHAEVVNVTFDTEIISLQTILEVFWSIHDPTTIDRQGNDVGTQYRSIILYKNSTQKLVIEKSIKTAQLLWDNPIVTEVKELEIFYPAEAEHQNYFQNHPEAAYCQVVINPKLSKFRAKFNSKIRTDL
jgi:methionine-S-sulfoxide reductase